MVTPERVPPESVTRLTCAFNGAPAGLGNG